MWVPVFRKRHATTHESEHAGPDRAANHQQGFGPVVSHVAYRGNRGDVMGSRGNHGETPWQEKLESQASTRALRVCSLCNGVLRLVNLPTCWLSSWRGWEGALDRRARRL